MCAHNDERFVAEAARSILSQDFADLELIVVDDGSTDGTADVLAGLNDARVRIVRQENTGLTRALNAGLALARGEYLARQDADDRSAPGRLGRQLQFLDDHPRAVMVGCQAAVIDEDGDRIGVVNVETDPGRIDEKLPVENQFVHGALMMRREPVLAAGGYRAAFRYAQDYDLVLRWQGSGCLANLPQELYAHRLRGDMVSLRHRREQLAYAELARRMWRERQVRGEDDVDGGADVHALLPRDDALGADDSAYDERYMHLCLRHGPARKVRARALARLRRDPGALRAWLYLLTSLFGRRPMHALYRTWDRLRAGAASHAP